MLLKKIVTLYIIASAVLAGCAFTSSVDAAPRQSGLERYAAIKTPELWDSPDVDWLNWVVVNAQPNNIGIDRWTDEQQLRFIAEFDPDMLDWQSGLPMNRGDMCRMRGLASSGSMEGFKVPIPPADSSELSKEDVESKILVPATADVSEAISRLVPKYDNVVKQAIVRTGVFGDSMGLDNLHAGIHGSSIYTDADNRRFVKYMREAFSSEQMTAMGFDPDKFNISTYLATKRKTMDNDQLIEEPIIHEYIRFYYVAIIASVVDHAEQLKRTAVKLGRPVPAFYGNTSSSHNYRTVGIPMIAETDVAWIEDSAWAWELPNNRAVPPWLSSESKNPFVDEMRAETTLLYKIGRAATHYRRPVWGCVHTFVQGFTQKRVVQGLALAEAYSNGGLLWHEINNWPAYGDCTPLIEGTPGRDVHRHHAQFVGSNRVLFIDRTAPIDVAIVKSIPSLFWRTFSSLDTERLHMYNLSACARFFEEQHIPYEVLILGHPDIFDDAPQLDRLSRYKELIIPNADCISDRQAKTISDWVRQGGHLVLWGEVGTRDEELRRRPSPVFTELINNPGKGKVKSTAASTPLEDVKTGNAYELSEAYRKKVPGAEEKLAKLLSQETPLVETSSPPLLWLNVWQHGAGPMMSVQMVNYEIDYEKDTVATRKDFSIRLRVPDGVTYARADYFFTDYFTPNAAPPASKQLPFNQKDGYVEVKIPHLEIFGTVVFSSEKELEARSAAAETRKWYERLKIAKRCPGQDIADVAGLLKESRDYLGRIQGNVQASGFSALIEPGKTLAKRLREGVEQVTAEVTALKEQSRNEVLDVEADYKFDFGEAEVAGGWIQVTTQTLYTPDQGHGWLSTAGMAAVEAGDEGRPDAMHRDYIRSRTSSKEASRTGSSAEPANRETSGQFRVDLPNGEYVVTVITGDYFPYFGGLKTSTTHVDINGKSMLYGDRYTAGYYQNRSCRLKVTDGQIVCRFWSTGYGPFYRNSFEWLVNGLLIQRIDQGMTEETQKYLAQAEVRSASAIRDWYVIGPFDDVDCTGLDTMYGPETKTDLNAIYQGKKGELKWQRIPRLVGDAPYVSLSGQFSDLYEVAGFAMARIYSDKPQKAVLTASTTQLGVGYVNGKEVFRDEYCAGLLPHEERVLITLKKGLNTILIKSLNHFGDEWALWAGLEALDGKPLKNIKFE